MPGIRSTANFAEELIAFCRQHLARHRQLVWSA
jgi:hypothetical protein